MNSNSNRFKNKSVFTEPFPILVYKNFLTEKENKEIYQVIKNHDSFDAEKFGGRKQIRMGSQNFEKIIDNNSSLKNVSNFLNNKDTFKYFLKEINNLTSQNNFNFELDDSFKYEKNPKDLFFKKNSSRLSKFFKKIKNIYKLKKQEIALQIDFSLSSKGYRREPHTDKPTRILVMLIYFNNLSKEDGGSLDIYKYKNSKLNYNSQPSSKELCKMYSFVPKARSLIVFQSNPVSVHSVSKMITDKIRVFAYGAYTLKNSVNWIKKN